jgi:hypothetical protein
MHLGRKRALVVSGAVATLLGAGALFTPSSAARCPVGLVCEPVEATSDGLGIIPDPTRDFLREILDQNVFPGELNPVYKAVDTTFEPAQAPVMALTTTVIGVENQVSGEAVPVVRSLTTQAGIDPYACEPSHDHKDHTNPKHCDDAPEG